MAKKDDVTTYTKAELIKALRASVAREAKLQKRIAALDERVAELQQRHVVEPAMRRYKDAAGARTGRMAHQEPAAEDQAPPAFPWDVK